MIIILKNATIDQLKYTTKLVEHYLKIYPDPKRITIDWTNPAMIRLYNKGEKDIILISRRS